MRWLETLTRFCNPLADARLPAGFPAEQLRERRLVDLGYQLLYNEPKNAYPTVKCCSKHFVLLSDVYRDPVPFLRILQRRIRKGTAKIVLHNITDVIPSQFLLLPDTGDGNKKGQCRYLEYEPNRTAWGIAGHLLKANGRELFKAHSSADRIDQPDTVPRNMPKWEISDNGDIITLHKWKLTGGDETAKRLADFINRTEAQGLLLPRHLQRFAYLKMRPLAPVESLGYPRAVFISELQQAAEQAVVFSHYLFGKFVDEIQDVYHFLHPEEGLSWRLYSWQLVRMSRTQLLGEIQKRFPEYGFHPLLSTTVLTAPEMEEKVARIHPEPVGAAALAMGADKVGRTASLQTVRYEPVGQPRVTLVAQPLDEDLVRYQQVFDMPLQMVSLTAKEGRLEEANFPEAALFIVTQIPALKDTWSSEPAIELVDPEIFWNPSTESQYGGVQGERLAYALFCSVYNQTPQWLIDGCLDDLLPRLFLEPLRPNDWVVYKLDTEPSSFFENDFWDYLWVVYHRDGKYVRVLYGTDTD